MVIPAISVNAKDIRRGSGGSALRWLRISNANDAQISTTDAYAKVMDCLRAMLGSFVVSVAGLSPHTIRGCAVLSKPIHARSRRTHFVLGGRDGATNPNHDVDVTYNRRPRR